MVTGPGKEVELLTCNRVYCLDKTDKFNSHTVSDEHLFKRHSTIDPGNIDHMCKAARLESNKCLCSMTYEHPDEMEKSQNQKFFRIRPLEPFVGSVIYPIKRMLRKNATCWFHRLPRSIL